MSKISYILMKNPVVVSTGTTIHEAAHAMKMNKVASILISKSGRLAGIVSMEDIVQTVADRQNPDITVDKIMQTPELTIESDKWISDAIAMFERCKVSHIAVVENGENVGIIRAEDVLHTYRFEKHA